MTAPPPRWAILDGQRVPHEGATVHVSDLGLRHGFAVFEAFRIEQGAPLFLEAHLARLERSTNAVGSGSAAASTAWRTTSRRS